MISGFLFTVFRCTIDILRQFEDLYVERKLGKFIYKSKSSYCVYNSISLDIILLNLLLLNLFTLLNSFYSFVLLI